MGKNIPKSAVIVIHESEGGPGRDLQRYLLDNKIEELLFISHPLLYFKEYYKRTSRFEYYRNGKLVKEGNARHWILPDPLLFIKDFLYTILWTKKYIKKCDLFVGLDNLNAFSGVFLKKLKIAKIVVYYVIDYIPKRFDNKLLNFVYHFIENLAAAYSNYTWNLSPRMIEARQKRWKKKYANQITVPHGVHLSRINRLSFNKINKSEIIYMGALMEKQGIQLILEALPQVLKKESNAHFTIIGKGPYEEELRKKIRDLNLEKHVSMLGHIKDHKEMENRLARGAIAVAMYNKENDTFSYYTDSGKIKNYLGAGLPVIMTDVPFVAREIEKEKCGFIVNYDKNDLVLKLLIFLSNSGLLKKYRENAINFAEKYEWNNIFRSALEQVVY